MSLLNKTSLPPLKEGYYEAILESYTEENVADKDLQYIRLNLKLSDRVINDNRFEKGLDIAISQLRKQLAPNNEAAVSYETILELAKTKNFCIHVTYTVLEGQTYRNIAYVMPEPVELVVEAPVVLTQEEEIPDSPFE